MDINQSMFQYGIAIASTDARAYNWYKICDKEKF